MGLKKVRLNYMDTDSFYPLVETDDLYKDNSRYVEKCFDTSNTCRKKK